FSRDWSSDVCSSDLYYAEFIFGYNGSERFHRSQRFGFFPSAGIAYNISNEAFWEPLSSVIPLLKFRATYGLVGNDAIGSEYDRRAEERRVGDEGRAR